MCWFFACDGHKNLSINALTEHIIGQTIPSSPKKAAQFSTERKSRKLPHTEWSMIPRGPPPGVPDVCIFDFTNLYAARVAARVTVR